MIMAIHVQCSACGAKFQAADKFAGKRVKCPKCSAAILVAEQSRQPAGQATSVKEEPQPISFACRCGKELRVKAELAGKHVKCPACGLALTVPGSPPAAASADGALDLGQLAAGEAGTATTLGVPVLQAEHKRQPSRTRLVVALSVGVGAAVLALLLVFLLWPSKEDKEVAKPHALRPGQSAEAAKATPAAPAAKSADSATGRDQQPVRNQPTTSNRPRTYPSFPDALTEPPAWIGSDAPFDVAKFLEVPPPEQNAAPLYLDALLEFSADHTNCFHAQGQKPDGETLRRAAAANARSKEYSRLEEAMSKAPASVDNAAVDAWLKGYETGFQKLAVAQQRPACVFETGIGVAALLPHIGGARHVPRIVKWRVRRDLARADFERSVLGVETVLRLSRDLRPRGAAVCQLVSVAVDNICCEETVPAILTATGLTAKQCDRLLAALVKHEAEARDPFLEATRLQYIMDRTVLHDLQHHTGMFDPQYMKDGLGLRGPVDSPLACLSLLQSLGAHSNRLAREKYGTAIPQTPEEALKHPLARGWSVDGKLLSDDQYAKEVDAVNRVYKSLLESGRTSLERDRTSAAGTVANPLRDTMLAVYLEPMSQQPLLKAFMRGAAILRGTKCLVALRRWQFEHPQPPPDLAALARSAGMTAVPLDPYTDQPLRMTTMMGWPVIYSIGPDGKDDRASPAQFDQKSGIFRGDFVFRLPPPQ
jgi:DNA-directed RNA polymerase subunit RPC12/RpoP